MAQGTSDNAVSNMLAAYLTRKTKDGVNLVGAGELPYWQVLDQVCTDTRVSFAINSVAKAFTEDGKRLLLALLGASRMVQHPAGSEISFMNLHRFRSTKSYHAGDVFAGKIGAGTALHRLVTGRFCLLQQLGVSSGYMHTTWGVLIATKEGVVCMTRLRSRMCMSNPGTDFQHVYHYVSWHIKQYGDHGLPVFILLEPSAQKVELKTAITAKLTAPQVFWNAEGRWQVRRF